MFTINMTSSKFGVLKYLACLSLFLCAENSFAQDSFIVPSHSSAQIYELFPTEGYIDIDMSPNGQNVAYVKDNNSRRNQLFIEPLAKNSEPETLDLGDREPFWAMWATDRVLLVAIIEKRSFTLPHGIKAVYSDGTSSGSLADVSMARLIAVDTLTGEIIATMFDGAPKNIQNNLLLTQVVSVLPDDPDHIIMAAMNRRPELHKVNIHSGKNERIDEGRDTSVGWLVNATGDPVIRFDADYSGRWVRVYTRAPDSRRWSKLTTIKRKDMKSFVPIAQADAPHIFFVSARPPGEDRYGVYRYDLAEQTYLEEVSSHPVVDVRSAITDENGYMVASVYFEDSLVYNFFYTKMQKHYEALQDYFGNEANIHIRQVSADENRWLLFVEGPRNPGTYHYYTIDTQKIGKIFTNYPSLKSNRLGKTEVINYTARDGQQLKGYVTHPPGQETGYAPVIVMPHGGPEARDYVEFNPIVQFFASKGYRVFQPNFRGSSGYGKAFAEAGYGEWGGLMQDDITDGAQHLLDNQLAKKGNICIAGISFGGYAALMGAVSTPDMFDCAVSMNGVTDLVEQAKYDREKFRRDKELQNYVDTSIGHYKKDKGKLINYSPAHRVSDIKIPVLVIQGTQDEVVPLDQGRTMVLALKEAGKNVGTDFEYYEFPMDHNLMSDGFGSELSSYRHLRNTLENAEIFIRKHIVKPSTGAAPPATTP